MMASDLFIEISSVLYQNRYCDQEDFDLIVSEVTSDEVLKCYARKIYKVKYPSYKNVETIHSIPKYSICDTVLTSGSNVVITAIQGVEKTCIDYVRNSFAEYNIKGSLASLPDSIVRYCGCIFMKIVYVFCNYGKSLCCDTQTCSWSYIESENMHYREYAARQFLKIELLCPEVNMAKIQNF